MSMKFFSRKKRISAEEFASLIFYMLVETIDKEHKEAEKFYMKRFFKESCWGIDTKRFIFELQFIYVLIIQKQCCEMFPKKYEKILKEFDKLLFNKEFEYLFDVLKEYIKILNESIERGKNIKDDSPLNDPIYCISKLASIRCFGKKEGIDERKIIMYSKHINSFIETITKIFSRFKVY